MLGYAIYRGEEAGAVDTYLPQKPWGVSVLSRRKQSNVLTFV